jgi:hypothetical protein
MCPIQFLSLPVFWGPHNVVLSEAKLQSSANKASPCLRPFQTGNAQKMVPYIDVTIDLSLHIFISRERESEITNLH